MSNTKVKGHVQSKTISGILDVAVALGVDRELVLEAMALDPAILEVSDSLLSLEKYYQLIAFISEQTGNPDFGLLVGRISYLENIHLNLYMASASRTLRDWLNMMPSVANLSGDIGEVRIASKADSFALQWHPVNAPGSRRCDITDTILCSSVLQMNSFCLLPVRPIRIDLSYERPQNTKLLQLMLGDNLKFKQKLSALHYDRAALDYPQAHVATRLYDGVAEEFARIFSHDASTSDPFSLSLHAAIREVLPKGDCSIEQIARTLAISRRTLQRRLSERGTNFQQLVQGIKSDLACKYLRDERLSVIQIAFLLGYGDHSTFSAAFKSWNAMSPSEFRQRLVS